MSEIRATTISDAAGTGPITLTGQTAAKAWVSWNFTSVDDSYNISSVIDDATGRFQTSFTSNMANAFYAESGITRTYHIDTHNSDIKSSSGDKHLCFYVASTGGSRTAIDTVRAFIVYHGDLA